MIHMHDYPLNAYKFRIFTCQFAIVIGSNGRLYTRKKKLLGREKLRIKRMIYNNKPNNREEPNRGALSGISTV